MNDLEDKLRQKEDSEAPYQPEIFDLSKEEDVVRVKKYLDEGIVRRVVDRYDDQLSELAEVQNPQLIFSAEKSNHTSTVSGGVWVYYPWNQTLVHVLNKEQYLEVKESRNNPLITPDDQRLLREKKIAIAGLNVGNPGAVCLALESVGSHFTLADLDPLSLSNLNRFRSGVTDLGVNKVILSARQLFEINPYLSVSVFENGIQEENITSFFSNPTPDLLIEEMDNLSLKVKVREHARELKIPVLMVTGNGPNAIVDIERFDLHTDAEILNGKLDAGTLERLSSGKRIAPDEKIKVARDFMGEDILDSTLFHSFEEVGKTIAGIPQLAESSFLRGALLTHYARRILLGDTISGRFVCEIDALNHA